MRQLTYKRAWVAHERIKQFLKDGVLVSWYGTDHAIVVVIRRVK